MEYCGIDELDFRRVVRPAIACQSRSFKEHRDHTLS
jgi:hypothetical protein